MPRPRLDQHLLTLGLTESREKARRLIMAGEVRVNGQLVDKPAYLVPDEATVELKAKPRFVSRGGDKLEAAFVAFNLDVTGLVCADVGASTGGFTDCLLQHAAAKVYAIDVGKGILEYKLRIDPRVVVMEETNARYVEKLPEPIAFISMDASFISAKILLPVVKQWTDASVVGRPSSVVTLIKPQFEAGKTEVAKGEGVIKDPKVHRRVLREVLTFAQETGYGVRGLIASPLLGPKGNREFLAWLEIGGETIEVDKLIDATLTTKTPGHEVQ
jgi:23S rRNA (cytidine1920-2'-O)/16S rRNA (cytidine1409-2'-O)-methyltransferase